MTTVTVSPPSVVNIVWVSLNTKIDILVELI